VTTRKPFPPMGFDDGVRPRGVREHVVLLGFDDVGGLWHIPDVEPPSRVFNEAACACLFSQQPIEVVVKEMPEGSPVTCLFCIAFHYKKLWIVEKGPNLRVHYDKH
jgi:hypothetical protein